MDAERQDCGVGEAGRREADPTPATGRAKVGTHLTSRPGDKQLLVEALNGWEKGFNGQGLLGTACAKAL